MKFTKQQQEALKLAAHNGEKAVDKVVAGLRKESPELFHDDASLRERGFYHQPNPESRIPHVGYVFPFPVK
jgi:hypothetical protein